MHVPYHLRQITDAEYIATRNVMTEQTRSYMYKNLHMGLEM